ncbi:hypothetical protein DESC_730082 [Desulfosarcina cetonica]|nr:hypothetical protein DESC_730082 [Desulfosarcina cetonica]
MFKAVPDNLFDFSQPGPKPDQGGAKKEHYQRFGEHMQRQRSAADKIGESIRSQEGKNHQEKNQGDGGGGLFHVQSPAINSGNRSVFEKFLRQYLP